MVSPSRILGDFMKNQLFALIGLGLLLATASAYAQTGVVKANVPFNFIVDQTPISAGRYVIQPIGTMNSGAMTIESPDGKTIKVSCLTIANRHRRRRRPSWFSTVTVTSISWPRSGPREMTGAASCPGQSGNVKLL
jgi:hypothetical protein